MKKLFAIRHIRWAWYMFQVERHYVMWAKLGMLPVNRDLDEAALRDIWDGKS